VKKTSVDMRVTHYARTGVVVSLGLCGVYAVVQFPAADGFPFPERKVVRISELKRVKTKAAPELEHEPAPF
jgi:hypothetical protein